MEKEIYKGTVSYDKVNKEFIDDEGMKKIRSMLKEMEYCSGSNGRLFFRPSDETWWLYSQKETYDTTLERISSEYIKENYSNLDINDRSPVDWLD